METIKKHKTLILSLLGASIAAITTVVLMKKKSKRGDGGSDNIDSKNSSQIGNQKGDVTIEDETHIKPAPRISKTTGVNLKIERAPDGILLSRKTVIDLLTLIIKKLQQQAGAIVKENRRVRRQSIDDVNKYVQKYFNLMQETEEIMSTAVEELSEEFGITKEEYNDSMEKYIMAGDPVLERMASLIPQMIKQGCAATKNLTREEITEILKYQVDIAEEHVNEMENDITGELGMMIGQIPGFLFDITMTRINDFVAEKFNVEEEDIMKGIQGNNMQADPEVQNLMNQYMQKLMPIMPQEMMQPPGGAGGPFMG